MSTVNYRAMGSGQPVVLIHGFPMSQQVWNAFAEKLSDRYQVLTVDLPGFGKSPSLPPGFEIEDVAKELLSLIRQMKYARPVIVGHSLGGYVALAMAEKAPEEFGGMCLFHSTALADSEEKKQSRDKVLDFIAKHGVQAFTSNFIGQLYADPQHSSITQVKNIAVQSTRETVEGYTIAMRNRRDRQHVLTSFPKPILFLAGEKDQSIPAETIRKQAALAPLAEVVILPEVGHMGMFEAEATCVKTISNFLEKCVVTFSPGKG